MFVSFVLHSESQEMRTRSRSVNRIGFSLSRPISVSVAYVACMIQESGTGTTGLVALQRCWSIGAWPEVEPTENTHYCLSGLCCCLSGSRLWSPWYNRHGWLGVKNQLSIYPGYDSFRKERFDWLIDSCFKSSKTITIISGLTDKQNKTYTL